MEVAPNNISVPLHPYQKQSLAFMLYREKDAPEAACGQGRYTKYPLAIDSGELCATYDNTMSSLSALRRTRVHPDALTLNHAHNQRERPRWLSTS